MVKILIADDHAIVRRGLTQIIKDSPGMEVTAEAGTGLEALDLIAKHDFDILVLDISMPGRSGLDVLKDIKRLKPSLPVLILSIHPEEQYAVRVFKSGASGYMTKDSAPEELLKALEKIVQGGKYVTPSLAEKMAVSLDKDIQKPAHELLSDREYQVLYRIAKGETVKEIAEDLFLSAKTVSTYRARILEKMNLKNNAELIHYAFSHHLID
ncbi:MAG: response regulator transcription factor [Candidatus Aminicenantes bacterium]|nr:response regulator transcription factor [Candidatus Aminicenantes bacterium]